ncbi:MAG: hypothetical protein KF734_12795 [Saprospiraceae bacterium]|nr:hypothetical protein [Saprospiraceae bacterium]
MRSLLFALLLLPLAIFSKPIRYEITPLLRDGSLRLQVRVWFEGDANGATRLTVPTRFGNAEHLFRSIQHFACTTPGSQLRFDADSAFVTVEHAPKQAIRLYYEVAQDFPGENISDDHIYRPILQPSYFHILGRALFIAPLWDVGYDVTLEWHHFPVEWVLHNSFGTGVRSQQFSFSNLRWLESVFVGGDYRTMKTEVHGQDVWLAIRGRDWSFDDDALLTMLRQIVEVQRDFWQDFDLPFYTVTLTPLAPLPSTASGPIYEWSRAAYFGVAVINSFTAFATPFKSQSERDLCYLFHHELMHNWIGWQIRCGTGPSDMRMAWFSEGFTEYFALRNMLKGEFITPDKYVEELNRRFFGGLYRSPKREASNCAVADSFFKCPHLERLPYLRGCVFAFFLDNAIKAKSAGKAGLHDLMLDFLEYYQRPDKNLSGHFDFFIETCSDYLLQDVEPHFEKFIQEGKMIPADAFVLPPYFKMEVNNDGAPFFWLDKDVAGWEEGLKQ